MQKRCTHTTVILIFLLFLFGFGTSAFAFSSVLSLGDSLTDDGLSLGVPFGITRFTDGDVWVETLAGSLGADLIDIAYGGATTGWDNPAAGLPITGLQWQLDLTLSLLPVLPLSGFELDSTLFTVWAGANDFFQGRSYADAVDNIATAVDSLAAAGAQSILVPNLPDLGLTPAYYLNPDPAAAALATSWSMAFNDALSADLAAYAMSLSGVDLYFLDVYSLFSNAIERDASGNIVDPLSWSALFMPDGVHPTSIGHQMLADAAYDVLQSAPVPEPATALLLGLGVIGVAGTRRRIR